MSTEPAPPPPRPRFTWRDVARVFAIVVPLALLYVLALRAFLDDGTAHHMVFTPGSGSQADRIDVEAMVLAVDPAREMAMVRLQLVPHGAYTSDNGRTVNREVKLRVNSVTGGEERSFPKDRRMLPLEVQLEIEGDPAMYPFDRYRIPFDLDLLEAGETDGRPVPIHITLDANLHGMDVFARQMPETTDGDVLLMLSASRAAAVVGYAVFIMFAMVLITIIVASIVVVFTVQKRKIEFSAFGWIGGLIFALPAVRNSMPGIPALGVLSDFLVFFWALGAVVVSYIFLVRIWIKRPA